MYVVARTAKRNTSINGLTLYLTRIGWWTLDRQCALEFKTREEAEAAFVGSLDCRVEGETTTEVDHALRLDQMNRARRRLMGTENCEDGKTSIAECAESYCQISGRCSLEMQDYTDRKEGRL